MRTGDFYSSVWRRTVLRGAERFASSKVDPALRILAETQQLSRDELLAWQWEKFKRLIDHSYRYVPYYRRLLDSVGMKPEDFADRADLERIPLLTKALIQDNQSDLRARGFDRPTKLVEAQTGGTTGEPLKFLRNVDCNSLTRAALLRSYTWTGYRIGDPILFLTGGSLLAAPQTRQQRIGFALMNFHFMPGFGLRRETLSEFLRVIRTHHIRHIRGYSTLIYLLAALCEEASITDIELDAAYPTAEMITKAQRETIERVFGCKIYDHYGCAEVNALANECPEGRNLHTIDEHTILEEINSQETGDHTLVITDLDNYAQPFIRYANADRGRVGTASCACGRNLGVLSEFLGRKSDYVILSDGQRFAGVYFHHLMGNFTGVRQFQVVQDRAGELLFRIVRSATYDSDDEETIRRSVREHTNIDPAIEYAESIERSKSGKLSSVICNVEDPERE